MATIKKFKIYIILFLGIIFLMGGIAMSSGKIRIFDFQYEKFEFLNGDVALELPGKSNRNLFLMYYKVLMDKAMSWEAGHFEISVIDVDKYRGPKKEEFKDKLVIKCIKHIDRDSLSIHRMAFWYGQNPIVVTVGTLVMNDTFPTEAEKQEQIQKDDEIFEHIIESFRYHKKDGTYAEPEIIRQPEEVKEIEYHGSEYHKNK